VIARRAVGTAGAKTFLVLGLGLPIGLSILMSLQPSNEQAWPPSLTHWQDILTGASVIDATLRSLALAAITGILATIIAWPAACIAALGNGRLGRAIVVTATIVLFSDPVARIFGWVELLKDHGLLNWLLQHIGLPPVMTFFGTTGSVILGTALSWAPAALLAIYAALRRIDPAVIFAARECGASEWRLLLTILVPLSRIGWIGGFAAAFLGSLGAILEPRLLGNSREPGLAELLQKILDSEFNWPLAACVALLLIVITIGMVIGLTGLLARHLRDEARAR
jgi:ABC-type spermidine/putrescine transport system permease subunit I